MKNKIIYFGVCLSFYLMFYIVEEILLTFVFTLFQWNSIAQIYLTIAFCFFPNLWLTWICANYIDKNYFKHEWLEKKEKK